MSPWPVGPTDEEAPSSYKTNHGQVPRIVVGRLALYMRELDVYLREGCTLISSQQLAQRIGVSSAQVRKDLSYFGDFGKQGAGYDVVALRSALCKILHLDMEWSVVVVGVGQLGRALIHNQHLAQQGFRIDAIFDNDRHKVGQRIDRHQIAHTRELERYVTALDCRIGVITTPATSAQLVAERLVSAGVLSILNYTSATIYVPEQVRVQSIDPVLHFYQMTYYLTPHVLRYAERQQVHELATGHSYPAQRKARRKASVTAP